MTYIVKVIKSILKINKFTCEHYSKSVCLTPVLKLQLLWCSVATDARQCTTIYKTSVCTHIRLNKMYKLVLYKVIDIHIVSVSIIITES